MRRKQDGFTLATAIFLAVILALLGAYIISVTGMQEHSSNLDLQGARAYQAARAGAEWGAYQSLRNNSCSASTNVTFPSTTAMSPFTATVRCTRTAHTQLTTTINIDQIIVTACNQPDGGGLCPNASPSANYIDRQVQLTIGR